MKLKDGFILRQMAGETVVIPAGGDLDMNMMITLNGTGGLLWQCLEQGAEKAELVAALLDKYDVDEATAKADVEAFLEKLERHGFLD